MRIYPFFLIFMLISMSVDWITSLGGLSYQIHPLKRIWNCLVRMFVFMFLYPMTSLLGLCPWGALACKCQEACTRVSTADSCKSKNIWKPPECSLIRYWKYKLWHIHFRISCNCEKNHSYMQFYRIIYVTLWMNTASLKRMYTVCYPVNKVH